LTDQWAGERDLGERLDEMPAERLEELAGRMERAESSGPTRPHPYLPHTGAQGAVTRRAMRVFDSFWDAVEGRFVTRGERRHHDSGLLWQYLLADPRFVPVEPDETEQVVSEAELRELHGSR
ncbi:MAG: hypothetical protein QM638_11170, partial [Nocardioides sp.]